MNLLRQQADFCDPAPENSRVPYSGACSVQRFLIVSAPFGPFGRELAKELQKTGASVYRVILNGGDAFDWGVANSRPFYGRREDWSAWIQSLIQRDLITDVITLGDSTAYAARALEAARALGVRTHIFEEGYFRPHWVTVERHGVNGWSSMPRVPEWYRSHPATTGTLDELPAGGSIVTTIRHIVSHHIMIYAGAIVFPHFRTGYSDSPILQAFGHIMRFVSQVVRRAQERNTYQRAIHAEGPKFLLVLQRPGDSQLRKHSDFESTFSLLEKTIGSFAAHAPQNSQLLVRPHPLDPGLVPHRQHTAKLAGRHGLYDSVVFSDYGKLSEILPKMTGVVCVNSTAGLAGVEFGIPTIALGNANYDMPGLTHQGSLEQFWTAPQQPDRALYSAFRSVVMALTQVNGGYSTAKGRSLAIPKIVKRLTEAAHENRAQYNGVDPSISVASIGGVMAVNADRSFIQSDKR